ncbi:hypothetical protein K2X92_04120 [Candidatus Gracilibacteria bacterium]|nr:hypothetical protein [Candidatus Gracilibacteria bacterium]
MKPIQKYIILIIGLSLFLLLGYIGFQNHDSSQLDESLHTQTNTSTNILKPDSTISNSENLWGGNPFQTGTTSTGETTKPEFKKPNTEWKTRTLSGITYVFGEGNPKEVALPESEMKGCSYQEGGDYCTDNGAGYVDPILEKLVYDLLTSPDWVPLLQHCEKDFRIVDSFLQRDHPHAPITYNTLVHLGQYISLEEVFVVNPQTGRKNIAKEGYRKLVSLYGYLQMGTSYFGGNPYPGISQCVDTYALNIANKLINIRGLPWRGSRDIPESQGGWDGKLAPLGQYF